MAYKHVMAAVDLSDEANQVLAEAQRVAGDHGAKLSLITVVKPLTQVYGGLDAGVVEVDDSDQAKPLVGSAVGLRTVGSTVAIDLAWQQVLTMPNGATPPDGIALLSISTHF